MKNQPFKRKESEVSDASKGAVTIKPSPLPISVYVSSAFINFLGLALPLTILHVYDRVLPNQAFNTLTMLVVGLFVVVAIDGALRIARGSIMGWRAAAFGHRQSMDAMTRLMSSKSLDLKSTKASTIISQFQALSDMAEFQGSTARLLLVDIAWVPVFAIVITIIAGPLITVPVVTLIAFVLYISHQTKGLRNIIDEREEVEERKYDFMLETLQSMQTVKSQAMEPLMMRRFERLQSSSSLQLKKNVLASQTISQAAGLFALLMTMGVVFFGAILVIGNSLTIGALAACMLLSSQMMQPIMRSLQSWTQIVQNDHKSAEVEKLYQRIASQPTAFEPVLRRQPSFSPSTIRIRDLAFVGSNDRIIFQNLNLNVSAGEFIGLKGADGSGRSVLLRSIMGEIEPTQGDILINDAPAAVTTHNIAYVGQVPQIFRGSILDNLTLFGTYSAEDAKWIADLTGLSTEIHRLPDGFDTQLLGTSNPELSAAFSQLICIARAVISKPSIILFDASNNGLDAKTEASFAQMLKSLSGDITIILATGRPSLLRLADQVYELSGQTGRVLPPNAPTPQPVLQEKAS